jgi:hypothetical protein
MDEIKTWRPRSAPRTRRASTSTSPACATWKAVRPAAHQARAARRPAIPPKARRKSQAGGVDAELVARQRHNMMTDLMVMAVACDQTRVFNMAYSAVSPTPPSRLREAAPHLHPRRADRREAGLPAERVVVRAPLDGKLGLLRRRLRQGQGRRRHPARQRADLRQHRSATRASTRSTRCRCSRRAAPAARSRPACISTAAAPRHAPRLHRDEGVMGLDIRRGAPRATRPARKSARSWFNRLRRASMRGYVHAERSRFRAVLVLAARDRRRRGRRRKPSRGKACAKTMCVMPMPPGFQVVNRPRRAGVRRRQRQDALHWPISKGLRNGDSGDPQGQAACELTTDDLHRDRRPDEPVSAGPAAAGTRPRPYLRRHLAAGARRADAKPVGKWSIITRKDGKKQWAYDNHAALYVGPR